MAKTKQIYKTIIKTADKTHTIVKKNNILKIHHNRTQKDRLYRERNNIKGYPN